MGLPTLEINLIAIKYFQWPTIKQNEIINTGDKPHRCEITQHGFINTGYKPDLCYSFQWQAILLNMGLISTGDKPRYEISQWKVILLNIALSTLEWTSPHRCEVSKWRTNLLNMCLSARHGEFLN